MGLKPAREHATSNAQTYFVTSKTWEGRALFRAEPWARLFFRTLLSYRGECYFLHEFVLMPEHFHLLVTPLESLERAVQMIKGGFSFRAKKELGSNAEIWQRGFADHRIRDFEDYDRHMHYIHLNPVKNRMCETPSDYRYSSAFPGWKLDPVPQGLKPTVFGAMACGTAEAVPFQSRAPQGLKPQPGSESSSARLKSCPDSSVPIEAPFPEALGPYPFKTMAISRLKRRPFKAAAEKQHRMPPRNDKWRILTIVAMAAMSICAAAYAQLDVPGPTHLWRLKGMVADGLGKPMENVEVTLVRNERVLHTTRTDARGRFAFDHVSGRYWVRMHPKNFSMVSREVIVGDEALMLLRRKGFYVVLGPGACEDDCSSVFTSKGDFDKAIRKKTQH